MEEKKNEKHCLQCLLREMDKNAYMENLYEYISHLDENIKADGALYEERLNVCKECKYLAGWYVPRLRVLRRAAGSD